MMPLQVANYKIFIENQYRVGTFYPPLTAADRLHRPGCRRFPSKHLSISSGKISASLD
uniref:Uncharacterized protein n=1 Tax=Arundo donax TaxID=35708 RepID=A0A0A9EC46_ARUDO